MRLPTFPLRSFVARPACAIACAAALGSIACAKDARDEVPANARVETLQTDAIVLRGTAPAESGNAKCDDVKTGPENTRYLELSEPTTGHLMLRNAGVAVLHVRHLDSNKVWCVLTQADGSGAEIPGEFSTGVYAISVSASHTAAPRSYEVVFEKL